MENKKSKLSLASLVLGLLGPFTLGLSSIAAIICGHKARSAIKKNELGGKALATSGLVLGYCVLGVLLIGAAVLAYLKYEAVNAGRINKEDYKGDGSLTVGVRSYGFGKTYGFNLKFEPFTLNQNVTKKYTLIDLPISEPYLDKYKINFDIVIGIAKSYEDLQDIIKRSNSMPEKHRISYRLTDTATGAILAEGTKKVSELEPTKNGEYRSMGFIHIKSLFELDMRRIGRKNRLELQYTYDTGGEPTQDAAYFFISLMTPTA